MKYMYVCVYERMQVDSHMRKSTTQIAQCVLFFVSY